MRMRQRWYGLTGLAVRTALVATLALGFAAPVQSYGAIDQPTTHHNYDRGVEAIETAHWSLAVQNLTLVVKDEPNHADAHAWLGYAYGKLGLSEPALRHLRHALKLSPRHVGANAHLGTMYAIAGDKARARQYLAVVERLCGRDCPEFAELAHAIDGAR